jgi:succinyl-CoA synthetase beta subunit
MAVAASSGIDAVQVLVQPMVKGGVETIVGAKRDPSLGWMVMVGMGGVDVESAVDVSVRPAPLIRPDAEAMIGELRGSALLTSETRGGSLADVDALVAAILSISAMTQAAPARVESIEINPLLVMGGGEGAVALDGLISFAEEASREVKREG